MCVYKDGNVIYDSNLDALIIEAYRSKESLTSEEEEKIVLT